MNQLAAEVALYRSLIACIEGRSDASALGRLKTLLRNGFIRDPWSFDTVLAAATPKLSHEGKTFYEALAAAILDGDKVADLDAFARWKEIVPIPLDEPWPREQ